MGNQLERKKIRPSSDYNLYSLEASFGTFSPGANVCFASHVLTSYTGNAERYIVTPKKA
jgi:hypothetical protein